MTELAKLKERAHELERDIWSYVVGPEPSGDGARDAFDAEIASMERELDEIYATIRASKEGL